jgi:hypothetical protein
MKYKITQEDYGGIKMVFELSGEDMAYLSPDDHAHLITERPLEERIGMITDAIYFSLGLKPPNKGFLIGGKK